MKRNFLQPVVLAQIQRLRCFRATAGWLERFRVIRASGRVAVGSAFPDKGIELSFGIEAQLAVKLYRTGVSFRHGEAQGREVACAQFLGAQTNQRFADAFTAMLRQYAHLRYVTYVFTDARTEQEPGNGARGPVHSHK